MFYKRQESFRYTFGIPPEVLLKVQAVENEKATLSKGYGLMLDISPKGAKLFSEEDLLENLKDVQLKFVLNHETITVKADFAWKKAYEIGWLYGVDFEWNPIKEMLIFNEVKELKEIDHN